MKARVGVGDKSAIVHLSPEDNEDKELLQKLSRMRLDIVTVSHLYGDPELRIHMQPQGRMD